MDSIFLKGLDRWRAREQGKVWHYRDILKKNNLKDSERMIYEGRVEELEKLVIQIDIAHEREHKREARTGEELELIE